MALTLECICPPPSTLFFSIQVSTYIFVGVCVFVFVLLYARHRQSEPETTYWISSFGSLSLLFPTTIAVASLACCKCISLFGWRQIIAIEFRLRFSSSRIQTNDNGDPLEFLKTRASL